MLTKRQQYLLQSTIVIVAGIIPQVVFGISSFLLLSAIGFPIVAGIVYAYIKQNKSTFTYDRALFIFLFLTCMYMLPFNFPNISNSVKVAYFLIMGLNFYLLQLAFNVYSVSDIYQEDIPLLQPARLVVTVAVVVSSYLLSIVTYKIGWFNSFPLVDFLVKGSVFAVYFFLLIKSLHWFFVNEKIGEVREMKMVRFNTIGRLVTAILVETSIILMFYPYEAFAAGIIVAASVYANMSVIGGYLQHKVVNRILLEYVTILVMALFIAYFIS